MSYGHRELSDTIFKTMTYAILALVLFVVLIVASWILNPEILILLGLLVGYTLILVLPVTKFKISATGVEADVDHLERNAPALPSETSTAKEAKAAVNQSTQALNDPRSVFLDLSIEIEKKLRQTAISRGISEKMGMGQMVHQLNRIGVITDPWLLDALRLFVDKRNQIVHEGRIELIQSAIDIGTVVLGRLEETNEEPLFDDLVSLLKKAGVQFEINPRLQTKEGITFYVPDLVIPDSKKPQYVVEVKAVLSDSQAYGLADIGRSLKANLPRVKPILIAQSLTEEMREFLRNRYWAFVFDRTQIKSLVSLVKEA
jgi:hypothetical protein